MTDQLASEELPLIYDDQRPILAVRFSDGREYDSHFNCHKIVAYREVGENSYVPFYAIYDYSGKIIARVPGLHVEVRYV